MQINVKKLRRTISKIVENTENFCVEFKKGEYVETIRPVRVTPLDSEGNFKSGEDSPGARKGQSPRGSTSTILPPGTKCLVLSGGKNQAWVKPVTSNGESFFDQNSLQEINRLLLHINKVCPERYSQYRSTAGSAVNKMERIETLKKIIEKAQKELLELENDVE